MAFLSWRQTLAQSLEEANQQRFKFAAPAEAEDDESGSQACGSLMWDLKTMSDRQALDVVLRPVDTTIAELTVERRKTRRKHKRLAQELKTYRVHALLVGALREDDEDYHLVLADPKDPSKELDAEIPDPHCAGANDSAAFIQLVDARVRYEALFGRPTIKLKFFPKPIPVVVTGVSFFDRRHGQEGVSPNAIELHPVFDVQKEP